MSPTKLFLPFTTSPLALNDTCCPTAAVCGPAGGTCVAVAVGDGLTLLVEVGVGLGGSGVPKPITMVSRLNPSCGPGLGQTPAWKFPNASKDPLDPPPPPQLLITRVSATNNTTGATI